MSYPRSETIQVACFTQSTNYKLVGQDVEEYYNLVMRKERTVENFDDP